MQKIVMFFKRSLICLILSFSLVCNNTAAVTYQAAAIPVVYSAWEVFVTIFALLGITLSVADTIEARVEAARELEDKFVGWKVLKGEGQGDNDGDGQDDLYTVFDPLDWIQGDKLSIPEKDFNDLKDFVQEYSWSPKYYPVDSNFNISNLNYGDFTTFMNDLLGDHLVNTSSSNLKSFYTNCFDLIQDNPSGILNVTSDSTYISYHTLNNNYNYGFRETNTTGYYSFYRDSSSLNHSGYYKPSRDFYSNSTGLGVYISSNSDVLLFFVNGFVYDFYSIFQYPIDSTPDYDYGTTVSLSDFVVPDNHFGDYVKDSPADIGGSSVGDLIDNGSFDIVTPDRDYDSDDKEVSGDVVVPMPSGDVLSDYQNGLITYEELLEKLGVTPIDKNTGTDLITGELLDTNIGILDGINSLVDFVGGLFEGLIEMFSSLFIPGAGYFESYFTRINDFFDSRLGFLYTPFDLLIRFLSALPSVDHSSTQLYFPGLKFQEYVLCEPMYVELNLRDEFPALYRYMYFITDTILIGAVLWLLQSKTKELIKG